VLLKKESMPMECFLLDFFSFVTELLWAVSLLLPQQTVSMADIIRLHPQGPQQLSTKTKNLKRMASHANKLRIMVQIHVFVCRKMSNEWRIMMLPKPEEPNLGEMSL